MNDVTKIIIYLMVGAIAVGIVMHSQGYSTAAGGLFNGFNSSFKTITGG